METKSIPDCVEYIAKEGIVPNKVLLRVLRDMFGTYLLRYLVILIQGSETMADYVMDSVKLDPKKVVSLMNRMVNEKIEEWYNRK